MPLRVDPQSGHQVSNVRPVSATAIWIIDMVTILQRFETDLPRFSGSFEFFSQSYCVLWFQINHRVLVVRRPLTE